MLDKEKPLTIKILMKAVINSNWFVLVSERKHRIDVCETELVCDIFGRFLALKSGVKNNVIVLVETQILWLPVSTVDVMASSKEG